MKKAFISLLATCLLSLPAGAQQTVAIGTADDIIPVPTHQTQNEGTFRIEVPLSYSAKGQLPETFTTYLAGLPLQLRPAAKGAKAALTMTVNPRRGKQLGDEGYELQITRRGTMLTAATPTGIFYGLQSLLQMTDDGRKPELACGKITDTPRFPYRGLLFDVSRHFRSKEFLMKQMDAMALLKLNRLHLHFTDGAGWRMQIDRYPRLTEFAAWRPNRTWSEWSATGARYCEGSNPLASGGFYTKDDIRELLAYAATRQITIIPDIEMPGHSEEVLAAYPELSCSGEAYKNADYCIGKEATFTFLQNVLDEIIELFPSSYIHIGGDEANKSGWKTCPDCQRRMKEEGIKDLDGLQSYFVHRMEAYINSKGRRMIGFDEILEGGLAPNATVMSWRGTAGGIKALQSGHDVIMTPVEYCYLDYTQDAPFREPESIGGYLPLREVYNYEPLDSCLTAEEGSHLLGIQGNLWTEYIPTEDHAEYMYYPRAFAIAETGWSPAKEKDYDRFRPRALRLVKQLQQRGFKPFDLAEEYGQRRESLQPINHLAKGAKVIYHSSYNQKYRAAGDSTFTDGILGGWTYRDNKWQGTMRDMDVVIDLGRIQPIHYVGATFMHSRGAWVHTPKTVTILLSSDGEQFTEVGTVSNDLPDDIDKLLFKTYGLPVTGEARYVRLKAVRNDRPGAWLFTDEIIVN